MTLEMWFAISLLVLVYAWGWLMGNAYGEGKQLEITKDVIELNGRLLDELGLAVKKLNNIDRSGEEWKENE